MKKFWISGVLLMGIGFIFCGTAPAALSEETLQHAEPPQAHAALDAEGLEFVAQSQAYQEFLKKPANDFSKMICLLNYFRTAPVIVQFEGTDYTPEFAYPFGLVYLMTNYRNEKPEQWARKHCYRSIFTNKIIYLKFRDGSSRPARDVIIEKFQELEEAEQRRVSKAKVRS